MVRRPPAHDLAPGKGPPGEPEEAPARERRPGQLLGPTSPGRPKGDFSLGLSPSWMTSTRAEILNTLTHGEATSSARPSPRERAPRRARGSSSVRKKARAAAGSHEPGQAQGRLQLGLEPELDDVNTRSSNFFLVGQVTTRLHISMWGPFHKGDFSLGLSPSWMTSTRAEILNTLTHGEATFSARPSPRERAPRRARGSSSVRKKARAAAGSHEPGQAQGRLQLGLEPELDDVNTRSSNFFSVGQVTTRLHIFMWGPFPKGDFSLGLSPSWMTSTRAEILNTLTHGEATSSARPSPRERAPRRARGSSSVRKKARAAAGSHEPGQAQGRLQLGLEPELDDVNTCSSNFFSVGQVTTRLHISMWGPFPKGDFSLGLSPSWMTSTRAEILNTLTHGEATSSARPSPRERAPRRARGSSSVRKKARAAAGSHEPGQAQGRLQLGLEPELDDVNTRSSNFFSVKKFKLINTW
ncbi:hypothetical protein L3X38_019715 [Prunus dulcis]|uniref:Uncharacterized protein n=1 Tax=Prunus dulcis TaxID=3755 RepID=A0AAD4WE14_PRUDU|nr:hypothetical protein L3X38_019715 [Prunus dulcis]